MNTKTQGASRRRSQPPVFPIRRRLCLLRPCQDSSGEVESCGGVTHTLIKGSAGWLLAGCTSSEWLRWLTQPPRTRTQCLESARANTPLYARCWWPLGRCSPVAPAGCRLPVPQRVRPIAGRSLLLAAPSLPLPATPATSCPPCTWPSNFRVSTVPSAHGHAPAARHGRWTAARPRPTPEGVSCFFSRWSNRGTCCPFGPPLNSTPDVPCPLKS